MNRKEFQTWLNQFDEDTIIECVMHTSGTGYYDQGGNATTTTFNPDMQDTMYGSKIPWCLNSHFEYIDFTHNKFVKPDQPHYKKKLLLIGGHDV